MAVYVIERRRTAGAYTLITLCGTEKEAKVRLEELAKQTSETYPGLTAIEPKPKDIAGDIVGWKRFGKSSHNNIILRIRKVE